MKALKDFRIYQQSENGLVDIEIKKGEEIKVPEIFIANLIAEGVIIEAAKTSKKKEENLTTQNGA